MRQNKVCSRALRAAHCCLLVSCVGSKPIGPRQGGQKFELWWMRSGLGWRACQPGRIKRSAVVNKLCDKGECAGQLGHCNRHAEANVWQSDRSEQAANLAFLPRNPVLILGRAAQITKRSACRNIGHQFLRRRRAHGGMTKSRRRHRNDHSEGCKQVAKGCARLGHGSGLYMH